MSELLDLRWENIPWWEWLVMREKDFAPHGMRSKYRFLVTGHQQPLGHRWIMSVGKWGGAVPTISLQTAVRVPNESTFQAFRNRWKTYCSRSPRDAAAIMPCKVSLLASRELERAAARVSGVDAGYAAYMAWQTSVERNKQKRGAAFRAKDGEPRLGILPIEYLLHHEIVQWVLLHHDIGLDSFLDLPDRELEEMWLEAEPPLIGVPPEIQEAYFQCPERRGRPAHQEHP